ncbi:Uncharacterised protein g9488 [Pycnogonum litorale]
MANEDVNTATFYDRNDVINRTTVISSLTTTLSLSTPDVSRMSTQNCSSSSANTYSRLPIYYRSFQVNPNWLEVRECLKWAWPLHSYGFASTFLLLSSYTFISLLTIRSHLQSKPYVSTINVLVLLLGLSRCVCLFADPYYSVQRMPILIGTILWQLGYPCLLSAFSFTQLAFNSSTKLRIGVEWFRSQLHISTAVAVHFSMILVCCVLPAFQTDAGVLFYVTQSLFIIWGLVLCSTFFYGGLRHLRKRKSHKFICSSKSSSLRCHVDDSSRSPASSKYFFKPDMSPNRNTSFSVAPKIRITDEFDHTMSYKSESPVLSSASVKDIVSSSCSTHLRVTDSRPSRGSIDSNITSVSRQFRSHSKMRRFSSDEVALHSTSRPMYVCRRYSHDEQEYRQRTTSNRRLSLTDGDKSNNGQNKQENIFILPKSKFRRSDASPENSEFGNTLIDSENVSLKMEQALSGARKIRCGHVRKLLKRIVVSAFLGIIMNILQSCLLYGPFGVTVGKHGPAVIPWFIFTCFFRFVELALGYLIASVARQPLPRGRKNEERSSNTLCSGSLLMDILDPSHR